MGDRPCAGAACGAPLQSSAAPQSRLLHPAAASHCGWSRSLSRGRGLAGLEARKRVLEVLRLHNIGVGWCHLLELGVVLLEVLLLSEVSHAAAHVHQDVRLVGCHSQGALQILHRLCEHLPLHVRQCLARLEEHGAAAGVIAIGTRRELRAEVAVREVSLLGIPCGEFHGRRSQAEGRRVVVVARHFAEQLLSRADLIAAKAEKDAECLHLQGGVPLHQLHRIRPASVQSRGDGREEGAAHVLRLLSERLEALLRLRPLLWLR
mmetsp:Transcript_130720/g.279552  ORF Transcript_130720/g.279552 Transcript_130720/m.279552 type:complete len:263 (+) Transcript_130720:66-854(+)